MSDTSDKPELPDLSKNPFEDENRNRRRVSLQFLEKQHAAGFHEPLDKVIRAWKGIQDISNDDPDHPDGFFAIAGYHGEPFHGPGKTDASYWGGYCNHNNVLFPTWHRAYLWRLEEALRKIPGCGDVTLPFLDEFSVYREPDKRNSLPDFKKNPPIPKILTEEKYTFNAGKGDEIDNPLKSYTLPRTLKDSLDHKNRYDKKAGYKTVRYPLSGLVGPYDKRMTELYNNSFMAKDLDEILNRNFYSWINQGPVIVDDNFNQVDMKPTPKADSLSVGVRLKNCLNAPNYMVFSNKVSSAQWVEDHGLKADEANAIQSLESPHNAIHLALGGVYLQSVYNADQAEGYNANGDMGENNTASMDPIFYFHHCFIDYVFDLWQKKKGLTTRGSLKVEMGYAGTNSSDSGGPPVFQPANTFLDMDTPLYPFKRPKKSEKKVDGEKVDGEKGDGDKGDVNKSDGNKVSVENQPEPWLTSNDVTDITEMGYSYGTGTMDPLIGGSPLLGKPRRISAVKRISGINRMDYEGSFVIRTYALGEDGKRYEVGRDEVLSRWNLEGCRNCQNSLEVKTFTPVPKKIEEMARGGRPKTAKVKYQVVVHGHGGPPEIVDATITDWGVVGLKDEPEQESDDSDDSD